MPRPSPTTDPELKAHREWLGYLQPVGLVVAPAAMLEAGWVVTRSGSELIERQERYREALEALGPHADTNDSDIAAGDNENAPKGFRSLAELLTDHLGWDLEQLDISPEAIAAHTKELPELGETLKPSAVVPAAAGDGAQLLVIELPLAAAFDQKTTDGEHLWRATAQERLERLLRETGVEAGLLFNGRQLRLVVAPKGESSGHLTFTLSELAEVSGRLMLSGLDLLLGQSHVFLDPGGTRLADVLKKSRSFQAVVSNALADQVLAALWDLLRGFQQADELAQRQDAELLADLPERDPQQLYGGLITVLMRLVFLLYAEDEALMPSDAVYEQNYKLTAFFEQLQRDEAEYPDTMEQRYGAWAGLMSLCRLVFDGGGPSVNYLPARKGQLFNPKEYPWLETPWISDGVVLAVLRNLLIVNGERISYRALDVEQIGSVYEGIMGYAVRRIPGRCIGLKSKPQGAKKQITTAVDLDALLALPGGKRQAWLEEEAGTTLPNKAATDLQVASTEAELLEALAPRIDRNLFDGPQAAGGLVFQPTEERRRSGSHYTPRSLTRPIVVEALRPWLERCGGKPTVAQILALKICDPAMGSGAFLVECCRYLAELLEQAWAREGLPDALKPGGSAHGEEPLIYARRLIAQSCLYGVDKNPFAVNLARLSLWLVSLSKDAPFTFVDHALKCGDSLVGLKSSEIKKALKGASRQGELLEDYFDQLRQQEERSFALFHADSRSDADDAEKRQALDELNASTAYLRTVGDLLVAAFFNGKKPKDRDDLKKRFLEETVKNNSAQELEKALANELLELREGEKGVQPLHWQLAFPDVFQRHNMGFDAIIGNPPFLAGCHIWPLLGEGFRDFIRLVHPSSEGKAVDLAAHFCRRSFDLIRQGGTFSLITTNTISQGDTRSAGLGYICSNGGVLYSCTKRMRWPGVAMVNIAVIHCLKGGRAESCLLNGIKVNGINSYLINTTINDDPLPLAENRKRSFRGHMLQGMGFVFEPSANVYERSVEALEEVVQANPGERDVVRPFLGGSDLNSNPSHSAGRVAICFGEMSLEEASSYPHCLDIVRQLVYPERALLSGYSVAESRKKYWWRYGSYAKALDQATKSLKRMLALSQVSANHALAFVKPETVCAHTLIVFPVETYSGFSVLQSRAHEEWARLFGSSLGDTLRYTPSDCFDTFAFPAGPDNFFRVSQQGLDCEHSDLEMTGAIYYEKRSLMMTESREGFTNIYNRFHDPAETADSLHELRRLHDEMDHAVLAAYGWGEVSTACGFGLDYLDTEEDAQLPVELQERIDSGELFFWDANDALDFQGQLQAYGAITGRRKLPWRYRWPDAVRDDVLARLLALNAERYAEEVAQGLHSKGGKKAAPAAGTGGAKRRGRPPKGDQVDQTGGKQTEQMRLGL